MALVSRRLKFDFELGKGEFGESGTNAVSLEGFRASAKIVKAGGNAMSTAQITIYGMTLSKARSISTLGLRPATQRLNKVTVQAGDEGGAMSAVFDGTITNAWIDFQGMPTVSLQVLAHTGRFEAIKPVKPTSYNGSVDAATILSGLATLMGKRFENNGVSVQISNPYYSGTAREQALACVKEAGINWNGLDDLTLAIWPKGQTRGSQVVEVSPTTGMIGYPTFNQFGISVQTIFSPSMGLGGKVKVDSKLDEARGEWVVYTLAHDLECETPGGRWHTMAGLARVGQVPVR